MSEREIRFTGKELEKEIVILEKLAINSFGIFKKTLNGNIYFINKRHYNNGDFNRDFLIYKPSQELRKQIKSLIGKKVEIKANYAIYNKEILLADVKILENKN